MDLILVIFVILVIIILDENLGELLSIIMLMLHCRSLKTLTVCLHLDVL